METTYNWSRLEPLVKNKDGLEQVVVSLVAGMTATKGTHTITGTGTGPVVAKVEAEVTIGEDYRGWTFFFCNGRDL